MSRQRSGAFTLIEVLVALAIFAILTVMAYQVLGASLSDADLLGQRMDRLRAVQQSMNMLGRDLTQAAPRPVRDPFDNSIRPALSVQPGTEFALEVTRAGWPNPAGMARSTMQRVAYRIEDGSLLRLHWTVLDPTIGTDPIATVLLEDVESIAFRFFVGNGQWTEQWPPQGVGGSDAARIRPRLVELTLTLADEGELKRFFEVAP